MSKLTQVEFNTIRELMGPAISGRAKFGAYSESAQDEKVKQMFQQMSNNCDQKAKSFLGYL